MPMDRPDGIPQWARDEAIEVLMPFSIQDHQGSGAHVQAIEGVARSVMDAHEHALSKAAKIAEDPSFTRHMHWDVRMGALAEIASAIRQHSQKGEK